ncbi:MAG: class I SAM-dependent methyltransferase [Gammaproteobacteria bacterium]|nr:class I SAM-dependent methyltransferase [Gammaproteobacteria bacterium]
MKGVDLSPAGIDQMTTAAGSQNLPITGVVADIESYQPAANYDILLIDRRLHMLKPEAQKKALSGLL